jgi:hypothetical protein
MLQDGRLAMAGGSTLRTISDPLLAALLEEPALRVGFAFMMILSVLSLHFMEMLPVMICREPWREQGNCLGCVLYIMG